MCPVSQMVSLESIYTGSIKRTEGVIFRFYTYVCMFIHACMQ